MSSEDVSEQEVERFYTPAASMQKLDSESIKLEVHEYELAPLGYDVPPEWNKRFQRRESRNFGEPWRGPLKVLKIFLLVAVIPFLFILVPLYFRYHVLSGSLYPLVMSDMRLIDRKISTTWCQKQVVKSNATFNAFLMAGPPKIANYINHVSMVRHLRLEDDMKEYWGFYLLEGSSVTVSTCVRWPGASLIMIRGHKHLKDCAYIGDDSSEEIEETLAANGGVLPNETLEALKKFQPSNRPENMTRHLSGVTFHEPRPPALNTDSAEKFHTKPHDEDKDLDPQVIHTIPSKLKRKQKSSNGMHKNKNPIVRPSNIVPVENLVHRYRETNVNQNEKSNFNFTEMVDSPDNKYKNTQVDSMKINISDQNSDMIENKNEMDIIKKSIQGNDKENNNSVNLNDISTNKNVGTNENVEKGTLKAIEINNSNTEPNSTDLPNININLLQEQTIKTVDKNVDMNNNLPIDKKDHLEKSNSKDDSPLLNSQELENHHEVNKTNSSSEISDDIYRIIKNYKDSDRILDKLYRRLHDERKISPKSISKVEVPASVSNIKEPADKKHINKKEGQSREKEIKRLKRELFIEQHMDEILGEEDEKGNAEIEAEFEPDGIADHHAKLNESTLNDMSKSEFWSSFSSSEEALLECDGLILNLPLTPNKQCEWTEHSMNNHHDVSRSNTITYKVPTNGYYFFVFNSENEIQENYIRVKFDLLKTVYDLNNGKVMECKNSTGQCFMPLNFFSGEKVVFEIPVNDNDSLWNESFFVESECEPRTLVYVICVIAVPIFILIMALY